MGSFANGIHVRTTDAAAVASAVDQFMRECGYEPCEQAPDPDPFTSLTSPLRALQVSDEQVGWVGVLDSDLINTSSLAHRLSAVLQTHVIQFMVHDSDAWIYVLYDSGRAVDHFDSSGGAVFAEEAAGFDESELSELGAMLDMTPGGIEQFDERVSELQDAMEASMPDEISAVQHKLQNGLQPSQEEAQKFAQWWQEQTQGMIGELTDMLQNAGHGDSVDEDQAEESEGEEANAAVDAVPNSENVRRDASDDDDDPAIIPMQGFVNDDASFSEDDEESFQTHLRQLQPLLPDGADERVTELLQQPAVFAEDALGEFMQVLEIRPGFAHLNYQYLHEWSDDDLQHAHIQFVRHLKYAADNGNG